jgi:hypothetical protein
VTVTVDINVLVDVFGNRQPYCGESAPVVDMIAAGTLVGVCPAHGLTTLYYLVRKHASKHDAEARTGRFPGPVFGHALNDSTNERRAVRDETVMDFPQQRSGSAERGSLNKL